MRNLIIAAALVIIIIVSSTFINRFIGKSYDDLSAMSDEYLQYLSDENYDEAKKILQKMKKKWEHIETYLKAVTNHETVELVGANFKISEIYLKYKDAPHAAAMCKELIHFLQHIHENEQVNLDNIF